MVKNIASIASTGTTIKNPIGKYGFIDYIRSGASLRVMRPTEVLACKILLNPGSPEFVPPAEIPSLLYCCQCRKRKPHDAFGKDARCIHRGGRRTECNHCRSQVLKAARIQRRKERKQRAKFHE
jgi:hypothetical protein